jgi:hypothetical protein
MLIRKYLCAQNSAREGKIQQCAEFIKDEITKSKLNAFPAYNLYEFIE